MKIIIAIVVLVVMSFSMTSSAHAQEHYQQELKDSIVDFLPRMLCYSGKYFPSCYDIGEYECQDMLVKFLEENSVQYLSSEFPDPMDEAKAKQWIFKMTALSLAFMEDGLAILNKRRSDDPKCNDMANFP